MKAMRKCNDEIYQLAKVKKLKNKRFRPFCLCLPGYKIFCNVNCKTPNVVYLLGCHVCGSQYVGESVQPFNKRMNSCYGRLVRVAIGDRQRLSPHGLHWPTVDEGLDTAALTGSEVAIVLLTDVNMFVFLIFISLPCNLIMRNKDIYISITPAVFENIKF
jgi:hypothetical protein